MRAMTSGPLLAAELTRVDTSQASMAWSGCGVSTLPSVPGSWTLGSSQEPCMPLGRGLADDDAFCRDAEQHVAAALIEHGSLSRRCLAACLLRSLELQGLRFAGCSHHCKLG